MSPITAKRWTCPLEDEITLPDGGILRTLGDAGRYVAALPEKVQRLSGLSHPLVLTAL